MAQNEDGLAETVNRLAEDKAYYDTWQEEAASLAKRYDIERFIEQLTTQYHLVANGQLVTSRLIN